MNKLFIDFETRSAVDIRKVGAWKYAMHPSTDIMCMGVNFEDKGSPGVWVLNKPRLHKSLRYHFDPKETQIVAHNAHFEYAIWNYILHKKYGWPALWEPEHWNCTMARGMMCGLPASLDNLGKALDIKMQKDMKGRMAMLKLSRPKEIDALGDPVWNEDEEQKQILYDYCAKDVAVTIEIDKRLPDLLPQERAIWELDLIINKRGVRVDVQTAKAATRIAQELKTDLNKQLYDLTGGAVDSATRVQSMKNYLKTHGVVRESLDKEAVTALLKDPNIGEHIKEVIGIRRRVGKSSVAKYEKMVQVASHEDNRIRGALQYHAAATGRWGGRLIQPQNYPQGFGEEEQKIAINAINSGTDIFSLMYGDDAMSALSNTLRGAIVAPAGKKLIVVDYSAIEARILFWQAGDQKALSMYKMGENLYEDMAWYLYHDYSITKKTHPKEYDVGKRVILGCGYQMGAERFRLTCHTYGVEVGRELAERGVKAYREKYNKVKNLWYSVQKAATNAIRTPGSIQRCTDKQRVIFSMDKKREYLVCKLPSGRYLRYYRPSIKAVETQWGPREEIHYWGVDASRKLVELKTYGGSLVENITQATARDILANGMINCEKDGFPIVLTVHDEIVSEIEDPENHLDSEQALQDFIANMCTLPKWADGLPLAAEGWIGNRYRK